MRYVTWAMEAQRARWSSSLNWRLLPCLDLRCCGGIGVLEEFGQALDLIRFADRVGGALECVQCPEHAAVRPVRPRDRTVALPAGSAQGVQAAVVSDAGEGIRLKGPAVLERIIGEERPREGRFRVGHCDVGCVQFGCGYGLEDGGFFRQERRLRAEEVRVHSPTLA